MDRSKGKLIINESGKDQTTVSWPGRGLRHNQAIRACKQLLTSRQTRVYTITKKDWEVGSSRPRHRLRQLLLEVSSTFLKAKQPNSKVIVNLQTNVSIWTVSRVLWKVILTVKCPSPSHPTALTLKRSRGKPDASTPMLLLVLLLVIIVACYKTRNASGQSSTFHNKCKSINPITSSQLQLQLWMGKTPLIMINKQYARQLILINLRREVFRSCTFVVQIQNLINLTESVHKVTTRTDLGKVVWQQSFNIIAPSLEMKKQ